MKQAIKAPTTVAQIATAIRVITRVDRSPLNAKQWRLTLKCDHAFWSTYAATKPKVGSKAYCAECYLALAREAANVGPV